VNVSSGLGSLAATPGGFSYAYCISKAALNMLTVLLHRELSGDGFTVVSLDPGWNRTDMGGRDAPLDPPTPCARWSGSSSDSTAPIRASSRLGRPAATVVTV
jgi:NAD(P)-dependent dehydrogenase (short-subunit alcohol dehydrogenase family)